MKQNNQKNKGENANSSFKDLLFKEHFTSIDLLKFNRLSHIRICWVEIENYEANISIFIFESTKDFSNELKLDIYFCV